LIEAPRTFQNFNVKKNNGKKFTLEVNDNVFENKLIKNKY